MSYDVIVTVPSNGSVLARYSYATVAEANAALKAVREQRRANGERVKVSIHVRRDS